MSMQVAINLAVIDGWKKMADLPEIFSALETNKIELPIRLWQESAANAGDFAGLKVIGFSNLLHATSIFPLSIFADEKIFNEQLAQLDTKLRLCNSLGCDNVSLGIDPWTNIPRAEARQLFIYRVKLCAQKAQKFAININLEYMSHNVIRENFTEKQSLFCAGLREAIELIKQIAVDNVKLLLDFLHWYCDSDHISLSEIVPYVGLVHICDHLEADCTKISDFGRVLPFGGVLPLAEFLCDLKKAGYIGVVSIEVFRNKEYMPTAAQIRQSVQTVKAIILSN